MVNFKVMLIVDDESLRNLMAEILSEHFYVKAVTNGADAIKEGVEFNPDLALIDFQIVDMSAVSLQREMIEKIENIHTAMITNVDRDKIPIRSVRRRAMDYIYRTDDKERFLSDVCKLVRYVIDVKHQMDKDKDLRDSGFYSFAQRLHDERKWTVDDIEMLLSKTK